MKSLFWADQIAEQIIERTKGKKASVKCQQTPSGAKHIGNLNDVVRAYFPYKSLLERGIKASFVHTSDDRDPLKDIPLKLADLNGGWHHSEKLMEMGKYLGMPLCRIPDPFGCCSSWSKHFTKVWMDGVYALGMRPELYSVDELYRQGKFDKYIIMTFKKAKRVGELVAKFQRTKGKGYIPFDAICSNCGRLANIDSFDLKMKRVHFVCGGKAIRKRKSEGCGYDGWVPWKEGKLQWRFEWPALWAIFNTTYEPFGKDHYEGSWKSGQVIAREIYEIEPPIPFVYEFFLVNGEKMSASRGNVYIVQDLLRIVEPEAFMFFYTKKPGKQRDLDLKTIHSLVEDFEHAERVYFGLEEEEAKTKENLIRSYQMASLKIPKEAPIRIPYQFAAMLTQYHSDMNRMIEVLKHTGHVKDGVSKEGLELVKKRLLLAKNWVELYAPEEYKIKLVGQGVGISKKISDRQKMALKEFAAELAKRDWNEKELHNLFWELAKRNNIEPKEFFRAVYNVLLDKDSGPRLAPFILAAGKERVIDLLKQI